MSIRLNSVGGAHPPIGKCMYTLPILWTHMGPQHNREIAHNLSNASAHFTTFILPTLCRHFRVFFANLVSLSDACNKTTLFYVTNIFWGMLYGTVMISAKKEC